MAFGFLRQPVAIREHIPLEQGLRHSYISLLRRSHSVIREHIPLEQGLRQTSIIFYTSLYPSESIFH